MTCDACAKIDSVRAGAEPHFVGELAESFVVLADHQRYEGWCILLLKDHAETLWTLPRDRQTRLFDDVARVANAIVAALRPVRLNYSCYGNLLRHVHWHVVPRYEWDPQPSAPVWVRPAAERAVTLAPDRMRELIDRLRRHLDG